MHYNDIFYLFSLHCDFYALIVVNYAYTATQVRFDLSDGFRDRSSAYLYSSRPLSRR